MWSQIAFTEKHKTGRSRWTVPASFPDPLVARAYLSPQADSSPEKFAWTVPDARSVRSFCSERLGWTEAQVRRNDHLFLFGCELFDFICTHCICRWTWPSTQCCAGTPSAPAR